MKLSAVLILIFSAFTFVLAGYKTYQVFLHPIKFENEIKTYSKIYDLDASIVASLINVESSYNSIAMSNKNAIGLMQIKLETANYLDEISDRKLISENELFNTETNIKYGCEYLRYLLNKFDDVYTAIASYNAGETRVRNWLKNTDYSMDKKTLINIQFKETENYIKKIKNNIKFYKKIYS